MHQPSFPPTEHLSFISLPSHATTSGLSLPSPGLPGPLPEPPLPPLPPAPSSSSSPGLPSPGLPLVMHQRISLPVHQPSFPPTEHLSFISLPSHAATSGFCSSSSRCASSFAIFSSCPVEEITLASFSPKFTSPGGM